MMKSKKAVIGIGTLIIFIATIVASLIAAGVLINATGLLQEEAIAVQQEATQRLVAGVDAYSVNAYGEPDTESIYGFDVLVRLRAGSNPIEMQTVGLALDSDDVSTGANLNSSLLNDDCTFENLDSEDEYCIINRFGDQNSTILSLGDLFILRYRLDQESELEPFQDFEITLTPRTGGTETLQLRTPELILAERIRLR